MAERPSLLDRLDLLALRLVKAGRAKHDDDDSFYEGFFTDEDVEKYLLDIRNAFRFRRAGEAYRAVFCDGPARVADIGAGLGMALRFLPPAATYLGVEFSGASIAIAERLRARADARFIQGGFPRLPVEDGWADLALCLEVVEHVPDDAQAIAELGRIVRPHGYLLLSVPGTYYWPEYLRLIGHYRHYTRAGLAATLGAAGFAIERGFAQFDRFWRLYHYAYLVLKACELVLRRTVKPDFSILRSAPYRWLARAAERHIRRHDPADDRRSTFVLCRKAGPAR